VFYYIVVQSEPPFGKPEETGITARAAAVMMFDQEAQFDESLTGSPNAPG